MAVDVSGVVNFSNVVESVDKLVIALSNEFFSLTIKIFVIVLKYNENNGTYKDNAISFPFLSFGNTLLEVITIEFINEISLKM